MDIYEDFDRATAGFSAYAILSDGSAIGRVIIRRKVAVTAYFQIWGAAMVKGQARGGGYDMATAAIENAVEKLEKPDRIYAHDHWSDIRQVMSDPKRDGETWTRRLEDMGFEIANVIA